MYIFENFGQLGFKPVNIANTHGHSQNVQPNYYYYYSLLRQDSELEMWANAQRDGRPAEYRWRPLFNAAKFG